MNQRHIAGLLAGLAIAASIAGCEPPGSEPQSDSHTNWLKTCDADRDCSMGLSCVCGICTAPCRNADACSAAPGSACLPATHAGAVAACAGQAPPTSGMCLPTCTADHGCAEGQACVAGACQPLAAPGAHVTVDTTTRLQPMTGFGATVGYAEDQIAAFADP